MPSDLENPEWRAQGAAIALEGAGKVEVAAALKDASDPAKSILTVQQEGLLDGDRIEEWRAYWKGLLGQV